MTEAGQVGALVELHTQLSDGYRLVDGVGRRSGYTLTEPMVKLAWEPKGALRQRLELKVGQTDFEADESYAGLSEADLRANPDRRYGSSRFDHHVAEQWRTYVKWIAEPDKSLRLESTAYYNQFDRRWDKLDGLTTTTGATLRTNVAEALVHAPSLAILRGDLVAGNDGSFYTNDAVRDHEAFGWQGSVKKQFETGATKHELVTGLRVHHDSAGGSNQRTTYVVDDGVIGAGTKGALHVRRLPRNHRNGLLRRRARSSWARSRCARACVMNTSTWPTPPPAAAIRRSTARWSWAASVSPTNSTRRTPCSGASTAAARRRTPPATSPAPAPRKASARNSACVTANARPAGSSRLSTRISAT
jgi:Fe(3+) dicitrate transport protein